MFPFFDRGLNVFPSVILNGDIGPKVSFGNFVLDGLAAKSLCYILFCRLGLRLENEECYSNPCRVDPVVFILIFLLNFGYESFLFKSQTDPLEILIFVRNYVLTHHEEIGLMLINGCVHSMILGARLK